MAAAGNRLYLINNEDASVWQYNGTPHSWTRIGERAAAMAAAGDHLYLINNEDASVWQYYGTSHPWTRIGERAAAITVPRY
jgi:hypothetical protein